jgi:NMD protein affecting ribosome stability and mRNA decay
MATAARANIDLLAWFDESERAMCGSCREQTAVGLPGAETIFCLGCGAVWLRGERLDVNRRIPVG